MLKDRGSARCDYRVQQDGPLPWWRGTNLDEPARHGRGLSLHVQHYFKPALRCDLIPCAAPEWRLESSLQSSPPYPAHAGSLSSRPEEAARACGRALLANVLGPNMECPRSDASLLARGSAGRRSPVAPLTGRPISAGSSLNSSRSVPNRRCCCFIATIKRMRFSSIMLVSRSPICSASCFTSSISSGWTGRAVLPTAVAQDAPNPQSVGMPQAFASLQADKFALGHL